MSDKYILRSGAIDAIKRNSGTLYTREAEFLLRKVILLLKNAPAADAAPVVRCKDCSHAYINSFAEKSGAALCLHWTNMAKGDAVVTQFDDFCSYGERKEKSDG